MNPRAGRGHAERRASELSVFCARLNAAGVSVEVTETAAPKMAARLAHEAASSGVCDVIVAGGDGTINEALQGLVGSRARLGIWPRGTANVLARELAIPSSLEKVVEIIAHGRVRRVHVGRAVAETTGEHRYFFLMAGVGLDASIVRGVRPGLKRRLGEGAFWCSGIEHLLRWQPLSFNAEVDGENFGATFAVIGNGASYGGKLSITPRARLDRREFEICLVDSRSRFRYLHLLGKSMRGGVGTKAGGVRYLNATQLRATGDALVQVDGELIGTLPMTFEVAPETIDVLA
ncbi:MAG: hypothetical protein AUG51_05105 [Acidobacteria bacterium 13_1_20CM_3_53_8]|nr:MAG: hypothetical protein AUG51_05105 [Acidobacteria bacterium 13_1_20CM_3_53_8]